jgi:hypothetical protein
VGRAVRSVGLPDGREAIFAVGVLIWLVSNMAVEVILLDTSLSSFICMIILARLAFVHEAFQPTGFSYAAGGDIGAYRRV